MGDDGAMEPIPETTEAVEEFGPFVKEGDLLESLREKSAAVRRIVPECVGLSVATFRDGVTFTLVATEEEVAVLDAVQYLAGGPCVAGAAESRVIEFHPTDEHEWQLFTRATAAASIASTLTLPILDGEVAVGSVNLYGASARCFTGHHDELARIFDAWGPGAVTNADLGFATRRQAELAPTILREEYRIEVAARILARRENIAQELARSRLLDAASRAAVPLVELAETLIDLDRRDDDGL